MSPRWRAALERIVIRVGLPWAPPQIAVPARRAHEERWDRALDQLVAAEGDARTVFGPAREERAAGEHEGPDARA